MSFSFPSSKTQSNASKFNVDDTKYGVIDCMSNGFSSIKSDLEVAHPLMESESNYQLNRNQLNMAILQNTQGFHAPLRIAMECKAAKKIGRLPFLPSSNAMLDSLTGQDLEIGPQDVFNLPEFMESLANPHAVVEKSLGIL